MTFVLQAYKRSTLGYSETEKVCTFCYNMCSVLLPKMCLFVVGFVRYAPILIAFLSIHLFFFVLKYVFNCPTDELGLAISNEELVKVLAAFFPLSASLQHGV